MRKLIAAPLAAASSYGWAQQLVAVAPPADGSGFVVIVAVALVGAVVFVKVKKPELFDKLLAKIKRKKPAPAEPVVKRDPPPIVIERAAPGPFTQAAIDWERAALQQRVIDLELALKAQRPTPEPAVQSVPPIPVDFTGFLKA